jgi:uncharacterized membrane protein YfcA
VCGVSADTAQHVATWVYVVVAIAILVGMCFYLADFFPSGMTETASGIFATLIGLFCIHRRHRDQEREKRVQYWREQVSDGQNLPKKEIYF